MHLKFTGRDSDSGFASKMTPSLLRVFVQQVLSSESGTLVSEEAQAA